jgi:hypothetical protein
VFENRMPKRILKPKRDKVTGDWRKLHDEELHKFYSSTKIIRAIKSRRIRSECHVARMWDRKNAYENVVGKLEGSKPLGRSIHRWEDIIKINLREMGFG